MKKAVPFALALFVLFIMEACHSVKIEKRKYRKGFYIETGTGNKTEGDILSGKNNIKSFSDYSEDTVLFAPRKEKDNISSLSAINKFTDPVGHNPVDMPDTVYVLGDTAKILVISEKVGEVIDSTEKVKYGLFPMLKNNEFLSAKFIETKNGEIFLRAEMKNGEIKLLACSKSTYENYKTKNFGETPELTNEPECKECDVARIVAAISLITLILGIIFLAVGANVYVLFFAFFIIFGITSFFKSIRIINYSESINNPEIKKRAYFPMTMGIITFLSIIAFLILAIIASSQIGPW